MNKYQSQLEAVQAKRLNMRQRVKTTLKSLIWLFAAIYFIPLALGVTWEYVSMGYGIGAPKSGWTEAILYVFAFLNSLALIIVFFYSLNQSKRMLTTALSGITE